MAAAVMSAKINHKIMGRAYISTDDGGNAPVLAHDPPVPVRVRHHRGQHGRGRPTGFVCIAEPQQRFRAEERNVAGQQHEGSVRSLQCPLGLQQRVPGAELRLLQCKGKAQPFREPGFQDLGLMADHDDSGRRPQGAGRAKDVLYERQPGRTM